MTKAHSGYPKLFSLSSFILHPSSKNTNPNYIILDNEETIIFSTVACANGECKCSGRRPCDGGNASCAEA